MLFSCLQLAMLFSSAVGPLFLPAVGPLFSLLFIKIIHLFTFTQTFGLSCVRSPASLFCECVSVAPRAPYTHRLRSVVPWFAKGLRFSRADPRVLFRTLHVLRVVLCDSAPLAPLPSARCACRKRCLQAGRELRHAVFVSTLVRRWEPSLELQNRRSAHCVFRRALLCSVSRDRPRSSSYPPGLVPEVIPCRRSARVCSEHLRVGRSWFVAMVWLPPLRPPGCSPAEAQSLRLLVSCVPRGQRALLDANMLELIDRFACLVELVAVESCAPPVPVLYPQQARPAPRPVAALEFSLREALWKVFCSLDCSLRAAPVASLRLLLLDDLDLSSFVHVAKRCVTLFFDVLLHVLHLGPHRAC